MSNGLDPREQYIIWRYDRARSFGIDLLKLLLSTSVVLAGIPILFYDRVIAAFSKNGLIWVLRSWTAILVALIFGFITLLFIFEGDYHAAHMEANRRAESVESFGRNQRLSNLLFNIGHVLGMITGIAFTTSLVSVIIAMWTR